MVRPVTPGVPILVKDIFVNGEYKAAAWVSADAFLLPMTKGEARTFEGQLAAAQREWKRRLIAKEHSQ